MKNTRLPAQLEAARVNIEQIARDFGLDFYPIIYEVLDYRTLYETAAFGGFPTRYPHWRFGMDFDQLLKGHVWAGSTIYEMVVNTNPSYAYLLEGNEDVTQKMVMAHVTGHVDFFKNNMWFAHTNRKMLDTMANHATRVQRIIDRIGYDVVEDFIDTCLSLENLIDYHSPYIRRPEAQAHKPIIDDEEPATVEGLKVEREYMRDYINPPAYMEEQRKKLAEDRARQRRFPEHPQKDILLFLMNYAPLERWQHTILEIVRDEAYYFAPQGMTKVINEGWACVKGGSLLYSSQGLVEINSIVAEKATSDVFDGEENQKIYDWAVFPDHPTIAIRTRRGLKLEGSVNHRLLLPDGAWRRLDELCVGDRVCISGGDHLWPQAMVQLDWQPTRRTSIQAITDVLQATPEVVRRFCHGGQQTLLFDTQLAPLVAAYDGGMARFGPVNGRRKPIRVPSVVDGRLAALLGYLCSDGHISEVNRTIGLSTGELELAESFAGLVRYLFDLEPDWRKDGNRWCISFSSHEVEDFLEHLGMKTCGAARIKSVPDVILRSPEPVVASFLRALYDSAGLVGDTGVVLLLDSERMSELVQLLLLNFGILSSRSSQPDGRWQLQITGYAAEVFWMQIGFGLERKHAALRHYSEQHPWGNGEDWSDEIVALEHGRATVYDISVTASHRYAAQGFINHNSYWHSTIMTQKVASASEIISFADLHSGVVATGGGRLNPYKLGLELLRDIEDRWNKGKFGKEYEECDDLATKRNWDRQLGLGRQKIFEIRKLYNDVTFIDEFLTPEFVIENKLFTFRYNRDTDLYEIASREFREIKEKLLFRLTNFGQPFIYVEDGNYNNRGELYLRHRHEGVDLKLDYARETMRNIHKIWTRPVHLETVIDERRRLLGFDGSDFTERRID
ncbi:SpoVR family protein [Candidatus Viridilinea mediisalina]|uniref:SpoVR family protein n=1 Tax=Candidatus Viridilinea mediisalina TaxID=2024553 RepID=A0A2A6RMT2_9CHLR|nr:SpoVR family protein [Candidatus Viridilinea mediisalina]PDW04169.1 SpoVR family protein [Candidatus Viridilinea mediisalina]